MGMKGFKNNMDAIRYAAEMVKQQEALYYGNGILTVDHMRGVHVTEQVFRECFDTFERKEHSEDFDQLVVDVDGVRVFCLVEKEKQDAAGQSV